MSQVSLVSPSFAILQLLLGASWEAPGFCLQLRGGLAQVKWALSSWKARSTQRRGVVVGHRLTGRQGLGGDR